MAKRESMSISSGQVQCCSYCSDAKFPCVNMERAMKSNESEGKAEDKKTKGS